MKRVVGALALVSIISISSANAGSIKTSGAELSFDGALTVGYIGTNNDVLVDGDGNVVFDNRGNPLDNPTKDAFHITTADVKLTNKIDSSIGFLLDMGTTYQSSLISTDLSAENRDFGVEIAYVSIRPFAQSTVLEDRVTIDAGILATNVGYELYHPYENKNIMFGMVWNGQPVTYTGVRATYKAAENLDFYAEYIQDPNMVDGKTLDGYAIGMLGTYNNIGFALSYFDYSSYRNIIDLVLSTKIYSVEVGINFDYQYLDDAEKNRIKRDGATNIEDSAYGIAVYFVPHLLEDRVYMPVRFEFVGDKDSTDAAGNVVDSGIYGVGGDSAYSLSITPTWKPNEHSFVRAEFDYIKTDKNSDTIFGANEDSRTIYAIEAGYMF